MPVTDTSKEAHSSTKDERYTQERKLYILYLEQPRGICDRDVADHMGWTPAHASARRNGLMKRLEGTDYMLSCVGKEKHSKTLKKVNLWAVKKRVHVQDSLF